MLSWISWTVTQGPPLVHQTDPQAAARVAARMAQLQLAMPSNERHIATLDEAKCPCSLTAHWEHMTATSDSTDLRENWVLSHSILLDRVVHELFDSPQNREKFQLPGEVESIRIENSSLVIATR